MALEESTIAGFLTYIVDQFRCGSPNENIDHPSGDGTVLVTRKSRGSYDVSTLAGPQVRVRRHDFENLNDFAEFVEQHFGDSADTDILVGDESVVAQSKPLSFNSSLVQLSLDQTVAFERWCDTVGKVMSQREFLKLLQLRRRDVVSVDEVIAGLSQFGIAIKNEATVNVDEHGITRAHSRVGKVDVIGTVPPELTVMIPVFNCILEDTVVLDLVVQVHTPDAAATGCDSAPTFSLHYDRWDEALLDARSMVAERLKDKLKSFLVGVGTLLTIHVPKAGNGD